MVSAKAKRSDCHDQSVLFRLKQVILLLSSSFVARSSVVRKQEAPDQLTTINRTRICLIRPPTMTAAIN